jgi:uncharacterized protein
MSADPITISVGSVRVKAELDTTPTARAIRKALPIEGVASIWGEEIYFEIPVSAEVEPGARADVAVGELAYWPPGNALCIFFGATPASGSSGAPRAASEVNPVGRVIGDLAPLEAVAAGEAVRIDAGA